MPLATPRGQRAEVKPDVDFDEPLPTPRGRPAPDDGIREEKVKRRRRCCLVHRRPIPAPPMFQRERTDWWIEWVCMMRL